MPWAVGAKARLAQPEPSRVQTSSCELAEAGPARPPRGGRCAQAPAPHPADVAPAPGAEMPGDLVLHLGQIAGGYRRIINVLKAASRKSLHERLRTDLQTNLVVVDPGD